VEIYEEANDQGIIGHVTYNNPIAGPTGVSPFEYFNTHAGQVTLSVDVTANTSFNPLCCADHVELIGVPNNVVPDQWGMSVQECDAGTIFLREFQGF